MKCLSDEIDKFKLRHVQREIFPTPCQRGQWHHIIDFSTFNGPPIFIKNHANRTGPYKKAFSGVKRFSRVIQLEPKSAEEFPESAHTWLTNTHRQTIHQFWRPPQRGDPECADSALIPAAMLMVSGSFIKLYCSTDRFSIARPCSLLASRSSRGK